MQRETSFSKYTSNCIESEFLFPATAQSPTRFPLLALKYRSLSLSSQRDYVQPNSTFKFRELPKRYEETLSRNRIRLTRKAFPLKAEKKSSFPSVKEVEVRYGKLDNFRGGSRISAKKIHKSSLSSKYDHDVQKCGRKAKDCKYTLPPTNSDGEKIKQQESFFLPEIVKISPEKRVCESQMKIHEIFGGPPPSPVSCYNIVVPTAFSQGK